MVRLLALVSLAACGEKLRVGELTLKQGPLETVELDDSEYQGKHKRYKAFRLAPLLDQGLPGWRDRELLFITKDGYVAIIQGSEIATDDAYVAVDDVDVPGFEPVGNKRVNPGPFYLVWKRGKHMQPYQLTEVQLAPEYPHTDPGDDAAAQRGFALFKQRCRACHAINRQGGRIGPELNVPKNITEYMPEPLLRQLIKNPQALRYGNMPPQGDLSDVALDELLAYLRAMSTRKHE